jgi:hypothetical protein
MSDERSQHLYRRLGYVDSGALFLPEEPAELILRKPLAQLSESSPSNASLAPWPSWE